MEEEDDDYKADDHCFFQQVALQRINRGVYQAGSVIAGDDFHTGRQRAFDLFQLLLYAVNDVQRVHAVAHDHDSAYCLTFSVPFGNSLPNVRPESDCTQVSDEHWRSVLSSDRHILKITQMSADTPNLAPCTASR